MLRRALGDCGPAEGSSVQEVHLERAGDVVDAVAVRGSGAEPRACWKMPSSPPRTARCFRLIGCNGASVPTSAGPQAWIGWPVPSGTPARTLRGQPEERGVLLPTAGQIIRRL